jgi:hypothetical protein
MRARGFRAALLGALLVALWGWIALTDAPGEGQPATSPPAASY